MNVVNKTLDVKSYLQMSKLINTEQNEFQLMVQPPSTAQVSEVAHSKYEPLN